MRKPYQRHLLAVMIVYALALLIYSNTFNSPFIFDDHPNIRDNTAIQISTLNAAELYVAAFDSPSANRPVANISFALNYLVGGFDVRGYHAVNLAIHVGNGVLVYFLALMLFGRMWRHEVKPTQGTMFAAALVTAVLFVAHPVQTQAVTYIVQRMTGLSVLFYLLSLLCFVRARSGSRFKIGLAVGCVLSGALAMGTKEIAASLPFAMLLIEMCVFRRGEWRWLFASPQYLVVACVVFALAGALYLGGDPASTVEAQYLRRDFSLTERLMTELRVVFFYLSLIAYPAPQRLNLLHSFVVSNGLLEPLSTLFCAMGLLAAIVFAIVGIRRRPTISLIILWFVLNSLIESSVMGLELVFEHRLYLPMFGVCLGLGFATLHLSQRTPVVWFAVLGVVLYLSAGTFLRNAYWADATTLWVDVVAKNPLSARANNNLGRALLDDGAADEALVAFNKALFIDPNYAEPYNNLGVMFAEQRHFEIAMGYLLRARELRPESAQTLHNIGLVLTETGRTADAIAQFREAIALEPTYAKSHLSLASLLVQVGEKALACEHLVAASRFVAAQKLENALSYCD